MSADLGSLQRWMLDAVRSMPGATDARSINHHILGGPQLTAAQQLDIYITAYFLRLRDIMIEEYPATQHAMGEAVFQEAVKTFLAERPSSSWTLNRLSMGFPNWLACNGHAFAADVAAVERAMEDVFDADLRQALEPGALQAIPPDQWGNLRLHVNPALQLLALAHPITGFMNAVRDDRDAVHQAPQPEYIVVYRFNFRRWRRRVSPGQFAVLTQLSEGATLLDALGAAVEADGPGVMSELGQWFAEWSADGFFVGSSV